MSNALVRLVLLQFVTVIYCILAVGLMLKLKFDGPAPPIFATSLRDFGIILFLVAAAWSTWGVIYTHRSAPLARIPS